MTHLATTLESWLRACPVCGKWFEPIGLCCDSCWQKLSSYRGFEEPQVVRGMKHTYLWNWHPGDKHPISRIILALKGGGPMALYRPLARSLVRKAYETRCLPCGPAQLVPAPSQRGRKDHAYHLALALHEELGWPIFDGLEKLQNRDQKKLGKHEREPIKIHWNVQKQRPSHPILIDDVLTTGSTAMASFRALGIPPGKVWTVAYRTSGFLSSPLL